MICAQGGKRVTFNWKDGRAQSRMPRAKQRLSPAASWEDGREMSCGWPCERFDTRQGVAERIGFADVADGQLGSAGDSEKERPGLWVWGRCRMREAAAEVRSIDRANTTARVASAREPRERRRSVSVV